MYFSIFLIASLCFSSISSLPTSTNQVNPSNEEKRSIQKRYSGQATWFTPNLGACGETNSESDYIVAMNQAQYGGGENCHKTVSIKNQSNGKTVTAKVTDECPGCGEGSLDLSPSVFKAIGDLDSGVVPISWSFS